MSGKHAETPEPDDLPSVEEQRADVAETVAALAAKADVPARVANEASFQAERAKTAAQKNPQVIAAAIGAVVAGTIVTIIIRRRRSRRIFR
ncbi:hypothetical protein HQ346_02290 [Rhodococcus sp. BP-252]|uniref:DUF3618 domain-containing protein n=1 Tax=Rhodococcoides kyotonense TaxID=398843 RepID=A0A177Y6L0_9NOCA|nr:MULTISPECIES: hypothetical protein [Rhodococcus]MBY6410381.1 hypothetical protein [Rhodococcus sp. BP-320]MBY6416263.1 hypothetical protein [Rhodococcus sp. BP-321]MBY6420258.1 hypothetical protein [Rhodococcus sp. BP-324]MBY6424937.1 hypothetical protein [Rhodococcus sp. BP-323]MBY6430357.1 hypothetical protein [Rhodococcus sp. BP-322]